MASRVPVRKRDSIFNSRPLSTSLRRMDDLFNEFFSPWSSLFSPWRIGSSWMSPWEDFLWPETRMTPSETFVPSCDIEETDSEYILSFDVPGVKKEDIRVEAQDDQLIVSGERQDERKSKEGRTYYRESSYGAFERRMSLPPNVDSDKIEANFENGVLNVVIPKTEQTQRRQIKIG